MCSYVVGFWQFVKVDDVNGPAPNAKKSSGTDIC